MAAPIGYWLLRIIVIAVITIMIIPPPPPIIMIMIIVIMIHDSKPKPLATELSRPNRPHNRPRHDGPPQEKAPPLNIPRVPLTNTALISRHRCTQHIDRPHRHTHSEAAGIDSQTHTDRPHRHTHSEAAGIDSQTQTDHTAIHTVKQQG